MANLRSITSANAQLMLAVPGLFDTPAPIQGFSADSAFANEAITAGETTMGIDGFLSGSFQFKEVKLKITLSPDSPSKDFFDQWFATEQAQAEVFFANAMLILPGIGESYTFTKGVLTTYHGAPSGKKKLEPVEYEITFQSISKSNS